MEFIVVGLVGGLSFLSYAIWKRSRTDALSQALAEERAVALLGSGEPNLLTLRPGDVVTHMTTDYIVEGAVTLDDDGRVTRLYRLADGGTIRWLGVRPGEIEPLVLDHLDRGDAGFAVGGSVPDQLLIRGVPYRLAARIAAKVRRTGNLGTLGGTPGASADALGERAYLYDYQGAGGCRILALSWNERTEAFAGEPVHRTMIQVLPAA